MPTFETHVGLTLRHENERVTIEGERVKLLYPLGDEEYEARIGTQVFNAVKAHYVEREKTHDETVTRVKAEGRSDAEARDEARIAEAAVGILRRPGRE